VISETLKSFWDCYGALSDETKAAARRAYAMFEQTPEHPSLRCKKLGGHDDIWSVRINDQYRAVGRRQGDTIVCFWVGSHNEFDKMF
jgi:hypothetical protein